jgi:hypothetical protein
MIINDILKSANSNDLIRAYFSDKNYIFFDISVFNVGVNCNVICTNDSQKINFDTFNGYDCVIDNDYYFKAIILDEIKERLNYVSNKENIDYHSINFNISYDEFLTKHKFSLRNINRIKKEIN